MAITNASRLADFGSGIGTAGAVLKIDNTAKEVGIGTTNPNATLTVGNIGASGTSIYVHGDGRITGVLTATSFDGNVSFASTSTVPGISSQGHSVFNTINASGILTASQFYGDGSTLSGVGVPGVSTTGHSVFNTVNASGIVTAGTGVVVTGAYPITLGTGTTIHQSASNSLVLGTNNKERVRIDSVGRIRIGTRATDNFGSNYNALQLHSESGANTYLALTNSTTGSNAVTAGFSFISVGVDGYINNRSAGSITLSTTDTERVRIDKSGNVNMTGVCTATSFAGDGSSLTGTVNTGKAIAMAMIFG